MGGARLEFKDPEFDPMALQLEKDRWYPHKMRLILRVSYQNIELSVSSEKRLMLNEPISLYLMSSKGAIILSSPHTKKRVEIKDRIRDFWHTLSYPFKLDKLDVISDPLSLQELHEIDELLRGDRIQITWSVDAVGFLDPLIVNNLIETDSKLAQWEKELRGPVYIVLGGPNRDTWISRRDFVKNVIEPADLLRREFIEVVVESLNEEEIDKLPDDFREALRILLEKQKLLLEVLRDLSYATTVSDYRDIIGNVRGVVEGLISKTPAGSQVHHALEQAFRAISIVYEVEVGALDELSAEIAKVIMDQNSFSNAIFKYSSKLGVHKKAESQKLYTPYPSKRDAEFAVLQAMILLNYIIATIKEAALKT